MSLINLEENKIYFTGTVFNRCFDQVVSFDTETKEVTLRDTFGETRTMKFKLDADSFKSYKPEFDTTEKIILYFLSIGMKQNLQMIPSSILRKFENTDNLYADLLGTLKAVNEGVREVSITIEDLGNSITRNFIQDSELEGMCCEVLITSEGRPNWHYIRKLESEGFIVFPTEKDSFGWLGAAVKTNKGVIHFG